jgi:hypothetical protein
VPVRRKWQFSLRGVLLAVFTLSILLAIAVQFPRPSAFAASMSLLLLVPLLLVAALCGPLIRPWPLQLLRLCAAKQSPPLATSGVVALASTLVLIGLWPVLREAGCSFSLLSLQPIAFTREDAYSSMVEAFSSGGYWLRLWKWEAWAVGRWWLLFGGLTLGWLAAALPFRQQLNLEPPSSMLARLLAFAPWLIVLEVCFLIGIWVSTPNVVPEPSTGFVVGIFSWQLWHWDCWLNREWLVRGALPSLAAGCVFFAGVLRWRWPAALLAAILLIPIALWLSVACTVAYQNGWPL